MEYVILIICIPILIAIIIGFVYIIGLETNRKTTHYEKQAMQHITNTGEVYCKNCKSTQLSSNKKGLSLATGLIGSQSVYITCLKCGHRWKAGH